MAHWLEVGLYFSPTLASLTSFPHIVGSLTFVVKQHPAAEFCPEFHLDSIKQMQNFPEEAGKKSPNAVFNARRHQTNAAKTETVR